MTKQQLDSLEALDHASTELTNAGNAYKTAKREYEQARRLAERLCPNVVKTVWTTKENDDE